MWGAQKRSKTRLKNTPCKNAFKKHPLQNRTNVQIKGGGVKGHLNNVQKNCTFLTGGLPLSSSWQIQRWRWWDWLEEGRQVIERGHRSCLATGARYPQRQPVRLRDVCWQERARQGRQVGMQPKGELGQSERVRDWSWNENRIGTHTFSAGGSLEESLFIRFDLICFSSWIFCLVWSTFKV